MVNLVENRFELGDGPVLVSCVNPTTKPNLGDSVQLSTPTRENLYFQQGRIEKYEPARPIEQNYLLWGGFFL